MVAIGRRSVPLTIVLSSISVALSIALVVGWILVIARNSAFAKEAAAASVGLLVGGLLSFVVIVSVLVLFTVFLVREIREVRRQTSFIDSVTHELKSPLASLRLCAETLARRDLAGDRREELRVMMLEDVQRLGQTVDSILQASRVGMGQLPRSLVDVKLAELVRDVVDEQLRRHRVPPHSFTIEVDPTVELSTDAHALRTVLLNLVDNAIKYSPSEVAVTVRARTAENRVEIEVEDKGIGIDRRDLKRIFQRFYRVPEVAVRERYGTGLGLFVVAALVREMGGKVEARSQGRDLGTTMSLSLPRHANRTR
jgi:signal transduction histidine kinase